MQSKLVIIAALLLMGCGAPNLAALRLEPALIQPGDLPAGVGGAQVRDTPPSMFAHTPPAIQVIDQRFQRNNENAGGVVVLLYSAKQDRDAAFTLTTNAMGKDTRPQYGVGEYASVVTVQPKTIGAIAFVDVAFVRCGALVHIRLTNTANADDVITYARRLDSRLMPLVC